MYQRLRQLEKEGKKIRVALVGAGAMGVGIAYQIARTPGMEVAFITDIDLEAARKAAKATGTEEYHLVDENGPIPTDGSLLISEDPFFLIDRSDDLGLDVLVEATNTIGFAGRLCEAAIEQGLHVILMNAEVDLALGPLLNSLAAERGVVVTSDAGDQHGVLATMIDEIRMWDFRIVMAGNIKGFLDRYATPVSIAYEAKIRNLNPVQCAAYTDGTKLCIEMALIGNGEGLYSPVPGMQGPRANSVDEVFSLFDFDSYGETGVVEYILGARPGGGVFVVGHCDDPLQMEYLKYYKLGEGPYYLFYRPYHLCHLETTRAIAVAALDGRSLLSPTFGRLNDVYAYAKRDVAAGESVVHSIGGDQFYGLIDRCDSSDAAGHVPIVLLEGEDGLAPRIVGPVAKDQPLTMDAVEFADIYLTRAYRRQRELLAEERQPVNALVT